MTLTKYGRVHRMLAVLALAAALMLPAPARADSITFQFNCEVLFPAVANCVPGGPFGTLTLTDSTVDPNRVDIEGHFAPGFGHKIERIFLNWNGPILANHALFLVADNAPPGVQSPTVGTVVYGNNTQTMGQFAFDIRVSPTDKDFDFAASLAFFNQLTNPDTVVNLDVAKFLATSVPTAGNPGDPPLYAGYRTHVLGGGIGEFWAGSTSTTPVPEPASLVLLGTGLIGLAGYAARRRAAKHRDPQARRP